jgi:hypothetical protein
VTRLLVLLGFSIIKCHFFCHGVFVGNGKHFFLYPRILHGKLVDQCRVLETLLVEHNDWLAVNL